MPEGFRVIVDRKGRLRRFFLRACRDRPARFIKIFFVRCVIFLRVVLHLDRSLGCFKAELFKLRNGLRLALFAVREADLLSAPVLLRSVGLQDVYNDFLCVLNRIYLVSGRNGEVNILCADDVAAGLSCRAFKLRRLNGVARRVVKFKRRLLRVVALNIF